MSRALKWVVAIALVAATGCSKSVVIRYDAVATTHKITGANTQVYADAPELIRIYQIVEVENRSDQDFTFKMSKTTACPDEDDGTVHRLPIQKSGGAAYSDPTFTKKVSAGKTVTVDQPVVFSCRYSGSTPSDGEEPFILMSYDAAGDIAVLPQGDKPSSVSASWALP